MIECCSRPNPLPEGEGTLTVENQPCDSLLRATVPRPKVELPKYPNIGKEPTKAAQKGTREAFWEELGGWRETHVFEQEYLETGNIIEGPALVEAVSTTLVLPPGAKLSVDSYRNMVIEQV